MKLLWVDLLFSSIYSQSYNRYFPNGSLVSKLSNTDLIETYKIYIVEHNIIYLNILDLVSNCRRHHQNYLLSHHHIDHLSTYCYPVDQNSDYKESTGCSITEEQYDCGNFKGWSRYDHFNLDITSHIPYGYFYQRW